MPDTPPPRACAARANQRGQAFASLLITARQRRGWTQDQLVKNTGISRSTIIRWESGEAARPDPDHVRAVCTALDIDQRDALVALGYLTAEEVSPQAAAALMQRRASELAQAQRRTNDLLSLTESVRADLVQALAAAA